MGDGCGGVREVRRLEKAPGKSQKGTRSTDSKLLAAALPDWLP